MIFPRYCLIRSPCLPSSVFLRKSEKAVEAKRFIKSWPGCDLKLWLSLDTHWKAGTVELTVGVRELWLNYFPSKYSRKFISVFITGEIQRSLVGEAGGWRQDKKLLRTEMSNVQLQIPSGEAESTLSFSLLSLQTFNKVFHPHRSPFMYRNQRKKLGLTLGLVWTNKHQSIRARKLDPRVSMKV